ncbi:MAG: hypothetical protein Q8O32_00440 [bacterium]|nr:hypothetical protein [bacterium]
MNRKKVLKIVLIFLIVIILVTAYFLLTKKKRNNIIEMVENFELYQEITDPDERSFGKDCNANEEFNQFKKIMELGSMKKLVLPGGMQVMITPNYNRWSNKKFLSFNTVDPDAFCGAGGTYPLHAYKNQLLWKQACSTGAMPEPDAPGYQEFMKCIETEEAIVNYFE